MRSPTRATNKVPERWRPRRLRTRQGLKMPPSKRQCGQSKSARSAGDPGRGGLCHWPCPPKKGVSGQYPPPPAAQIRYPRAETRKKAECRRPKPRSGISDFGFRPSFGPRISGFGFGPLRSRVSGTVQIRPPPQIFAKFLLFLLTGLPRYGKNIVRYSTTMC